MGQPHATRGLKTYAVALALLVGTACLTSDDKAGPAGAESKPRRVYVVQSGWHSGLIFNTRDISRSALPEIRDFSGAAYVEFGWGDWDYYQAPDPGLGLATKAAFWSRGSVLHVYPAAGSLETEYAGREVLEVAVDELGFKRVLTFVSATFSRPKAPEPAQGWSVESIPGRFYKAEGEFHLFRNCNTWIADALRSAGIPVSGLIVTSGSLMEALRPYAHSP
ncbi:MAG TPA: DUF2459 domain-containing protein [Candidatus Binatia bacterium]|nr:DUF2459 domain-containing protein [Candidatus Binatia bacterium]